MKPLILLLALSSVAWAGPYEVKTVKNGFCWVDMQTGSHCADRYYVESFEFGVKGVAEDFAEALNEAHERRTAPKEGVGTYGSVRAFMGRKWYCDNGNDDVTEWVPCRDK